MMNPEFQHWLENQIYQLIIDMDGNWVWIVTNPNPPYPYFNWREVIDVVNDKVLSLYEPRI